MIINTLLRKKPLMTIKEEIMREAGLILRQIFLIIVPQLVEGKVLSEIDSEVSDLLKQFKARSALKMLGFPANLAISLNKQVIQGIPDSRKLMAGDLVSVDMTLYYKGFFVDKAISLVLDPQHYIKRYVVKASRRCLEAALLSIRPGIMAGEIGAVMENQAAVLKVKVCKELFGHTIGESHHMKPLIPNYNNGSGAILRLGDFIAVEPIIFYDYYILEHKGFETNANQLSAHTEETILITKNGGEIIS
jgi:methionyl aminopeptidase